MLLTFVRAAVRRLLLPLVRFCTAGTLCQWQIAEEDDRMLIIIIDPFGQSYSLPQSAAEFRAMAAVINQMVDENDPQTRSL